MEGGIGLVEGLRWVVRGGEGGGPGFANGEGNSDGEEVVWFGECVGYADVKELRYGGVEVMPGVSVIVLVMY